MMHSVKENGTSRITSKSGKSMRCIKETVLHLRCLLLYFRPSSDNIVLNKRCSISIYGKRQLRCVAPYIESLQFWRGQTNDS